MSLAVGQLEHWRMVALEFHAIQFARSARRLPEDFGPAHLASLPRASLTPAAQGVIAFLLHVWNTDNRFELGQIQRWDSSHRQAFVAWVTGAGSGEPCRYF